MLPPCPVTLVFSSDGVLCPYHTFNTDPNAVNLVQPCEPIHINANSSRVQSADVANRNAPAASVLKVQQPSPAEPAPAVVETAPAKMAPDNLQQENDYADRKKSFEANKVYIESLNNQVQ